MFKHPLCGGRHETIAQARACEAGQHQQTPEEIRDSEPIDLNESKNAEGTWPWAGPKTVRPAKPAYPATKPVSDKKFKPLGVAYAEALAVRNGEPYEPAFIAPEPVSESGCTGYYDVATFAQVNFIQKLMEERNWESGLDAGTDQFDWATDLAGGKAIGKHEASSLIGALKALPKRATEKSPAKEQPWRTLSREVPAGYYAVQDSEGKNHFYRVSVGRNGFFKLQEQASDDLHFIPLNRYAGILQSILDFGLDRAGKFYATERSACRKCNRTLTDNIGNPYFEMGYGPDCGGK
jgi:hypothetical protein